jgi:hypothetical protein
VGTLYGQPQGRVGGTDYRDDRDTFPARVTHLVTASGEATRLGFWEQWQQPVTGAYTDRPDGRQSDGTRAWAVGVSGVTHAVGDRVLLRRHDRHPDRFEIVAVASSGGTGLTVVVAAAANAGAGWTAGTVQAFDAGGDITPATPTETVDLKPLAGRLAAGAAYACVDTGRVVGGRRRLRPVGPPLAQILVGCGPSGGIQLTPTTIYGVNA